MMKFEKYKVCQ